MFHHAVGSGRGCCPVLCTERTKQRCHHNQFGPDRRLLLFILVSSDTGPSKSSIWTSA